MIRKEKLFYIVYLRAIAIILIVAGHTILWGKDAVLRSNLYLFTGGTFLFVFIAGYLFEYLSCKFNYKDYLFKKFTNVIMPYFVTLLPAAVLYAIKNPINGPFMYMPPAQTFFSTLIVGSAVNPPLWFIPMISVFFLLAPVFLFIRTKKFLWYSILILSVTYTIFAKRVPFLPPPVYETTCIAEIFKYYIILLAQNCLLFLSFYLGGMAVCEFTESRPDFFRRYLKPVLAVSAVFFIISGILYVYFTDISILKIHFSKIFMIIMLLSFFMLNEQKIKAKPELNGALNFLADYSFGIFFIHHYFINLFNGHHIYMLWQEPLISLGANTFHCFLCSIGMFAASLFGSIILLWIIKQVLKICGIKNTRKFIGV